MTSPHWPLSGLRLCTPRLELRWPSLEDLDELVTLAAAGVHDPRVQPFGAAWTDVPAAELPGRSLRFLWSQWAFLAAGRLGSQLRGRARQRHRRRAGPEGSGFRHPPLAVFG